MKPLYIHTFVSELLTRLCTGGFKTTWHNFSAHEDDMYHASLGHMPADSDRFSFDVTFGNYPLHCSQNLNLHIFLPSI